MNVTSYARAWTDDYLDLYNFALSIGDKKWQEEILETLRNKEAVIQQAHNESIRRSLWSIYDAINRNMLDLFHQLRQASCPEKVETLREQMWDLKRQRLEIAKKIRAK